MTVEQARTALTHLNENVRDVAKEYAQSDKYSGAEYEDLRLEAQAMRELIVSTEIDMEDPAVSGAERKSMVKATALRVTEFLNHGSRLRREHEQRGA